MASKVMSIRLTDEEQKMLDDIQQYFSNYETSGIIIDFKMSYADIIRLAIRQLAENVGNIDSKD